MEQVKQVEQKTNEKPSKYSGLATAMAALLMIGFWFGIGAILAIKMVSSLEELIKQKIRLLLNKMAKKQEPKEPQ